MFCPFLNILNGFVRVRNNEALFAMHGTLLRFVSDNSTRRVLVGAFHGLREKSSQKKNIPYSPQHNTHSTESNNFVIYLA